MKLTPIIFVSSTGLLACGGRTQPLPEHYSDFAQPSVSCSPQCIPNVACGCFPIFNPPLHPACQSAQGFVEFDVTVPGNTATLIDLSQWLPGLSPNPAGGCLGWAVFQTYKSASGAYQSLPYVNSAGNWDWYIQSSTSAPVTIHLGAWSVIGSGTMTAPLNDPDYLLKYEYTAVTAPTGTGLNTMPIAGVTDSNSFSGVLGTAGDFFLGEGGAGGGVLPGPVDSADSQPGASFAGTVSVLTLYRLKGGLSFGSTVASGSNPTLIATSPWVCAFQQDYSMAESLYGQGSGIYQSGQPNTELTTGRCIFQQ